VNDLLTAAFVTLALAAATTLLLLATTPFLAWWLARTTNPARPFVEALVALPLVLPPTVIGFYLLLAMNPDAFAGGLWLELTGRPLAFSFAGLVIGSIVYSLPFVAQPLTAAFRAMDTALLDAATNLGAGPRTRFFAFVLPLNRRALVAAGALGFAHTLGEFGIVLMIGGNIPGETRVLSIALFDQVEALRYDDAHRTAAVLVLLSAALLTLIYRAQRRPAGTVA
jgi:molybdate transport system permease protein